MQAPTPRRAPRVSGHVLAAPVAAGGGLVSVPALLTRDGERRLRAGTPIVRLLIRGRARISAPRASGSGRVRIKPLDSLTQDVADLCGALPLVC